MPEDIERVVIPPDLEIPVLRIEPPIQDLRHLDPVLPHGKPPRLLLSPIPGIAFHVDPHEITHMGNSNENLLNISPWKG
jgi:hypothetical protein